jgi:hypothetical protein
MKANALSLAMLVCTAVPLANAQILVPRMDGEWWQVAGDPDLGRYTSPKQEPVDFSIWQAADGTWQLLSCIRNTNYPGNTRLFHRWQAANITDRDWKPMGVAYEADPGFGEGEGKIRSPHVVKVGAEYFLFYGNGDYIAKARSRDGKTFSRQLQPDGTSGMFTEGPGNLARDPMVIRIGSLFHMYYTAWPDQKGYVYLRTSPDLNRWSDSKVVAFGGAAGTDRVSAECPFVYHHAATGFYYLFRTQRYGANAQTTVYRSKDPANFGVNDDRYLVTTLPIAAPEIVEHAGQLYIASLLPSLNGIRIAKLTFEAAQARKPDSLGRPKIVNNTLHAASGQVLRGDHLFLTGTTGNTRGDEFTLTARAWAENANLGFNSRRLWASGSEPNDEAKFRKIDRCIELAAQAGQYVILLYGPNDPKARLAPGTDHHRQFWSIAAPRYKDRAHVIYDLYNEPEDAWPIDAAELPGYTGGVPMAKMVRDLAPDTAIIHFGNMWLPRAPSYYQQFEDNFRAKYGRDWSWANALVGFHGYYNVTTAQMQAIKERWPCINTEAPSYYLGGGVDPSIKAPRAVSAEEDWDAIVRMEKLGIAWSYFNHVARIPYGEPAPVGYRWMFPDFDSGPFADHMVKNGVAWWTPGPAVSITTPEPSDLFTAPADIAVAATVMERGEAVKKVEFFGGAAKLGESKAPPYTFTWKGVKEGSYSLTARVTDQRGRSHTSFPVKITVAPAGLSKAAVVTASAGAEEPRNPKEGSYDGKPNTRWASNAGLAGAWITYDLGSTQTVAAVKMRLFNGRILKYPIKIEVGDGSTMTEVWSGTTDWWEKTAQFFQVTATPGRYVRVSMTANNTHENAYFSACETEVYVAAKSK